MSGLDERTDRRARRDTRWMWPTAAGILVLIFAIRLTWALAFEMAEGGGALGERVFEEITGALTGALTLVLLVLLLQRFPLIGRTPWRSAGVLAAAFVPLSIMHTWSLLAVRTALGPAFGLSKYTLAVTTSRYVYEGMTTLVHTIAIIAVFTAVEAVLARNERERRQAALERTLLDSELRALRLRLEPHFLFNALNTISSTMYADVRAADAQLAHLAALLRGALRTAESQEVSLAEELELLEHYVSLLHARFEERLVIEMDIAPAARDCRVPSLVLQPLVENAIRHGALERTGRARVSVAAAVSEGQLHLRVFDDGPGLAPGRDPLDTGTGLSATVQRLRLLHGEAARFTVGNVPGGFAVELVMPAQAARLAVASRTEPAPALAERAPEAR
jgi:two-component sensor histidine kinase